MNDRRGNRLQATVSFGTSESDEARQPAYGAGENRVWREKNKDEEKRLAQEATGGGSL